MDLSFIRSLRWICFLISLPLDVALCPDPDLVDPADPIELLFELLSRWFRRNSLTKLAESHRVSWENRCFMWRATSAERLVSMMEINCCRSGRTRSNSSFKGFFSYENFYNNSSKFQIFVKPLFPILVSKRRYNESKHLGLSKLFHLIFFEILELAEI